MLKKTMLVGGFLLALALFFAVNPHSAAGQAVSNEFSGMTQVPAGEFWMGRTHLFLFDALNWVMRQRMDDQPARPVFLDQFSIDKYEVTTTEYHKFTEATGHPKPWYWKDGKVNPGQENWPVYNVSWEDAAGYCRWAGKRLPTEAEWEKAARGGLDRRLYPWGDELETESKAETQAAASADGAGAKKMMKMAHYEAPNGPKPVGSFPANGYGIHDMVGNVWEWVNDWYERDYYSIAPAKNPAGPEMGTYRVMRGGGWSTAEDVNSGARSVLGAHYRSYAYPGQVSFAIGFRCAKNAPPVQ